VSSRPVAACSAEGTGPRGWLGALGRPPWPGPFATGVVGAGHPGGESAAVGWGVALAVRGRLRPDRAGPLGLRASGFIPEARPTRAQGLDPGTRAVLPGRQVVRARVPRRLARPGAPPWSGPRFLHTPWFGATRASPRSASRDGLGLFQGCVSGTWKTTKQAGRASRRCSSAPRGRGSG